MWIENVAAVDILDGHHNDAGSNSMLIQIADPCGWFPEPKHQFKEIHKFEFLDIGYVSSDEEEFGCNEEQAKQLVDLLKHAFKENMNVVVHCIAGICRSGAVCEVGTIMGFEDLNTYRIPNSRVKYLMMKELGLTYDSTNDIYDEIVKRIN